MIFVERDCLPSLPLTDSLEGTMFEFLRGPSPIKGPGLDRKASAYVGRGVGAESSSISLEFVVFTFEDVIGDLNIVFMSDKS